MNYSISFTTRSRFFANKTRRLLAFLSVYNNVKYSEYRGWFETEFHITNIPEYEFGYIKEIVFKDSSCTISSSGFLSPVA